MPKNEAKPQRFAPKTQHRQGKELIFEVGGITTKQQQKGHANYPKKNDSQNLTFY